jgi:hypothetical protein
VIAYHYVVADPKYEGNWNLCCTLSNKCPSDSQTVNFVSSTTVKGLNRLLQFLNVFNFFLRF